MKSQWDCIRQNIGSWYGSFTQFDKNGEQVKDTPSVLTLEETEPERKMQLTLKRTPSGESTNTVRRDFSAPGPAPYVYFFENGSFSQGSSQWAAFSQFGTEMSIKAGDRRARFVVMYESTVEGTSRIKYVTLIRETRDEEKAFGGEERSLAPLQGGWKGQVKMLYASMAPLSKGDSEWRFETSLLECCESFDESSLSVSLSSEEIDFAGGEPVALQGELPYKLMPLPNGTYCLIPQEIRKGEAFRVEVGWVRENGRLDKGEERSRLIRYYDTQGVWTHAALIEDERVEA